MGPTDKKPSLSAFFESPYLPRTSRLSPIPDNSPVTPLQPGALRIVIPGNPPEKPTVNSPLLMSNVNTPAGDIAAQYPFPDGRVGLWKRRMRALFGTGSWHGGLVKRAVLILLLAGLIGLVMYREVSLAFGLGSV